MFSKHGIRCQTNQCRTNYHSRDCRYHHRTWHALSRCKSQKTDMEATSSLRRPWLLWQVRTHARGCMKGGAKRQKRILFLSLRRTTMTVHLRTHLQKPGPPRLLTVHRQQVLSKYLPALLVALLDTGKCPAAVLSLQASSAPRAAVQVSVWPHSLSHAVRSCFLPQAGHHAMRGTFQWLSNLFPGYFRVSWTSHSWPTMSGLSREVDYHCFLYRDR